ITTARRIPHSLKLEARYYIALNQFLLGQTEGSWETIQKLVRDEDRPVKLGQARVLKGRLHLARGEAEEGIEELEGVTQAYPRTQSSSEAQYYLGEYHFHQSRDLDKALTAYNKVRSEYSQSELAETAQQKAAAINQLKQSSTLDQENNLQQFVDYHISAAENYYNQFALQDSALVMYQRLIDSRDSLLVLKDSLLLLMEDKQSSLDSLSAEFAMLPEPLPKDTLAISDSSWAQDEAAREDTLAKAQTPETEGISAPRDSLSMADSLGITEERAMDERAPADSQKVVLEEEPAPEAELAEGDKSSKDLEAEADSLFIPEEEFAADALSPPDSLGGSPAGLGETGVPDSLLVEGKEEEPPPSPAERRATLQQELNSVETELSALESRIANLDGILQSYETEYIPLALFSQASIYNRSGADSTLIRDIHSRLQEEYPGNKYTNALEAMLTGAPIRLVDPVEEAQELRLDEAFGLADTQPDSMLVILNELADSEFTPVRIKANFRLGWYYTFEEPDTSQARPYLEEVLNLEQQGDHAQMTTRFFDGRDFNLNPFDELAATIAEADSLKRARELEAEADSLNKIEDLIADPDTIDVAVDSTAVPDSLAANDEPEEQTESEKENQIQRGEEGEIESAETPERKEELPESSPPDEPQPGGEVPDPEIQLPDEPSG
ncbi:MAG: tetratricopeptide repeat protein, partial [Candidatus Syntrophosphaera sp.]